LENRPEARLRVEGLNCEAPAGGIFCSAGIAGRKIRGVAGARRDCSNWLQSQTTVQDAVSPVEVCQLLAFGMKLLSGVSAVPRQQTSRVNASTSEAPHPDIRQTKTPANWPGLSLSRAARSGCRLGHASPAITLKVYAHLFRKDDGKAAAAINAALAGRPPG
jgi:hypothetical protein